jgi:hypothetical protein
MGRSANTEPSATHSRLLLSALSILIAFAICPGALRAQEVTQQPSEEIVANLAAGRVVIAVVKDAIIIATVENPIESQTHPPVPVQLNVRRAGVLLGAVDWFSPTSDQQFARLDRELPHLRGDVTAVDQRLDKTRPPDITTSEATDLESVGQGVLQRLSRVASNLHAKVNYPPNEPIVQLIVAGFVPNYGPEVWELSFSLTQEMRNLEYYDTKITRPVYVQFWPPEKTQLHSLLEFQYPPEIKLPQLLDLLKTKDPRIEKICAADPKMREVADRFLQGDYKKILVPDATQFLRAALAATTDPKSRQTMAVVNLDSGFEWVLKPPAEPKPLAPPSQDTGSEKDRPAERPSLLGPPSP